MRAFRDRGWWLLAALASVPPAAVAGPGSGPTAAVSHGRQLHLGRGGALGRQQHHAHGRQGRHRPRLPAGGAWRARSTRPVCTSAGTEDAGCHRSDVSEIHSASLAGGRTGRPLLLGRRDPQHLPRRQRRRRARTASCPRPTSSCRVARASDVKLVMLSIGGNDLGFAGIISACLQAYVAKTGPCEPSRSSRRSTPRCRRSRPTWARRSPRCARSWPRPATRRPTTA